MGKSSEKKKRKRRSDVSTECFKEVSVHAKFSLLPHALEDVRVHVFASLQDELLRYSAALGGVPIKFFHVALAPGHRHGIVSWNDPHIFVEVRVKSIVFCPEPSQYLVGRVNKIGIDFVGLLVFGLFNASIAAANLKKFDYDETHEWWAHTDDADLVVKLGTAVVFELLSFDHADGIVSLDGKLRRVLAQEDDAPNGSGEAEDDAS
mmetsp:Transcript_11127/g.35341  ORF Transcript_11127/g.35341 Transcript_11127/m.35341 type:complete len:206 (-) Transcript_11127:70-687(-)